MYKQFASEGSDLAASAKNIRPLAKGTFARGGKRLKVKGKRKMRVPFPLPLFPFPDFCKKSIG
jgi:hypothetical protein